MTQTSSLNINVRQTTLQWLSQLPSCLAKVAGLAKQRCTGHVSLRELAKGLTHIAEAVVGNDTAKPM